MASNVLDALMHADGKRRGIIWATRCPLSGWVAGRLPEDVEDSYRSVAMRMAVTRVAASTPRGWAGRGNKRRQCRGIACAEGNCAVELVAAGVATRQTRTAETFGLRNGPHVNLVLNDVELPADELIGKEGNGLRQSHGHPVQPPHPRGQHFARPRPVRLR